MRSYESLEVGEVIIVYYNEGNVHNRRYEIRGRIDDHLVIRTWLKHKRRWQYSVEGYYWWTIVAGPYARLEKSRSNRGVE